MLPAALTIITGKLVPLLVCINPTQIHLNPLCCADYACQIFHDALNTGHHECFLKPDTRLPMMYVDDCLRSITEYLVVPADQLRLRTYNVHAMSFTPEELAAAIRKYVPDLKVTYQPDSRQAIGEFTPFKLILFIGHLTVHPCFFKLCPLCVR